MSNCCHHFALVLLPRPQVQRLAVLLQEKNEMEQENKAVISHLASQLANISVEFESEPGRWHDSSTGSRRSGERRSRREGGSDEEQSAESVRLLGYSPIASPERMSRGSDGFTYVVICISFYFFVEMRRLVTIWSNGDVMACMERWYPAYVRSSVAQRTCSVSSPR